MCCLLTTFTLHHCNASDLNSPLLHIHINRWTILHIKCSWGKIWRKVITAQSRQNKPLKVAVKSTRNSCSVYKILSNSHYINLYIDICCWIVMQYLEFFEHVLRTKFKERARQCWLVDWQKQLSISVCTVEN